MSVELGFEDLQPYLTSTSFVFSHDPCILHVAEDVISQFPVAATCCHASPTSKYRFCSILSLEQYYCLSMRDLTSVLGAAGMTGMFRVKMHIQTKNGNYSFQNTIKKRYPNY